MHFNSSIFIILVTLCRLDISALPITDVSQMKIFDQFIGSRWFVGSELCVMGTGCNQSSDCCNSQQCGHAVGYDSNSNRCCGTSGTTGCTVVPGTDGKGCCWKHFCSWVDETKTETICRRTSS